MDKKSLILVDIQNDFLSGGALAVPDGEQVVPTVNKLIDYFDDIYATKDWHPIDHGSFAKNHPDKNIGDFIDLNGIHQILWPEHCVQNTYGSELSKELNIHSISKVFTKGMDRTVDSYSAFYDNARKNSTGLGEYLKKVSIDTVYLTGLATDYCVKYSALDAVNLGFSTYLIEDCCRGINLTPGDIQNALDEMKEAGVIIIQSRDIQDQFSVKNGR